MSAALTVRSAALPHVRIASHRPNDATHSTAHSTCLGQEPRRCHGRRPRQLKPPSPLRCAVTSLCLLCEALGGNTSVTHLDLSNNSLWGVRGARELRRMLARNGGLRVLLLPFCNIASPGEPPTRRSAC